MSFYAESPTSASIEKARRLSQYAGAAIPAELQPANSESVEADALVEFPANSTPESFEVPSCLTLNSPISRPAALSTPLREALAGIAAGGANVYGIYKASISMPLDIAEQVGGHFGFHAPTVQLLKNQWNHFISTHGSDAKFLQICHSGSATDVKNGLLTSPEWVRQHIIVVAIAPSEIVPKKLCFQSHNYVSKRDFVPYLDIMGVLKYGNQLHVLEPHPDAKPWDHELLSPTFAKPIQYHITNHFRNYGSKK